MQRYFSLLVYTVIIVLIPVVTVLSMGDEPTEDKWQKLNDFYIRDIVEFKGEIIFCANEGIFNLNVMLNDKPTYCLESNDEIIVAGTNEGLLLFDSVWKKIEILENGYPVQVKTIKRFNNFFFLGHIEGGYGVTTWHPKEGIIYQHDFSTYIHSMEIANSTILAGDEDGHVWISENMGNTFDSTMYLDNQFLTIKTIKYIDSILYIGAGWIYKDFKKTEHYLIPSDFESIFVATGEKGVMIMDDNLNLVPFNEGLEDLRTSCLFIYNNVLYCGTVTGLYRRPLTESISKLISNR